MSLMRFFISLNALALGLHPLGCGDDDPATPPDAATPDAAMQTDAGIDGGVSSTLPSFILEDALVKNCYDGTNNDLLSGGLGVDGLRGAAPGYVDAANPTAEELRRNALYGNYRAIVDTTSGGGFGRLFGPNIDADGNVTEEEMVPGCEYIAFSDDGSGNEKITLVVQVPDSFDVNNACIITGPSSGSRGVYGAIGSTADWAFDHNCAMVYVDQGKGMGFHNLQNNQTNALRGERVAADNAGANFAADITEAERTAFNQATPNRFAIKHHHSQQNPQTKWGTYVLQAIEFGFYAVNEDAAEDDSLGDPVPAIITPDNTLVISAGISNGGAAALYAAEQDTMGLIDAVVVSEPNAQPEPGGDFTIVQGSQRLGKDVHTKTFVDYYTFSNLYQPCASLAASNDEAPLFADVVAPAPGSEGRCASLATAGLVTGATTAEQAADAMQKLTDHGFAPEQHILQPSHEQAQIQTSIAVGYVTSFGRHSVLENKCGFSFAATDGDGAPTAIAAEAEAVIFATGNGIPPTGGVNVIYNDSRDGAIDHRQGISESTDNSDASFDGAQCLRQAAITSDQATYTGQTEAFHSSDLRGLPAIIVMGRADAVIPINHSARPYYANNKITEGNESNLVYYEVLNAHHLDAFNVLPDFGALYVPIHYYFEESLDLMWAHMNDDATLPPSQVVRTTPRGKGIDDAVPDLDVASHLPDIAATPEADDAIAFANQELVIPD